jgi:hypothetical protein
MAKIFGKEYTKKELMDRFGNIGTIAGVRMIEYKDGFANGLRAYEVVNGPMRFTANIDRCLDIGELYYNGIPLYFLSRPGIMSNSWWYNEPNSSRSIMCGMMFTCGLTNVGPSQTLPDGKVLPQHGFIRSTPAETFGARTYWDGDDYYIELSAVMRESSLFGTNLVLRRTILTKFGDPKIEIRDEIENESSTDKVPLMLMYHCNFGFPFVNESTKLVVDAVSTKGRDEVARIGMENESPFVFGKPETGYKEQVFYHRLKSDNNMCSATIVNPEMRLAVTLKFDNRELPNLIHWKCKDAGNYVIAAEPSNCHPEGIIKEAENGTLRYLAANERIQTGLTFSICSSNVD